MADDAAAPADRGARAQRRVDGPSLPSARPLSRRTALVGGSAIGGGLLLGHTVLGGSSATPGADHDEHRPPTSHVFFDRAELRTLSAMVSRIIPGDEDDPGALEAGVTYYIDHKLASFEDFAEPTYLAPPFAEGYRGDPPEPSDETVPVAQSQLYRYGHQAEATPQRMYREGLAALDRLARDLHESRFDALAEDRQIELLELLDDVDQRHEADGESEEGAAAARMDRAEEIFGDIDPGTFFSLVRTDCIEGMFADPQHGGNRGLVGWTLIGYPGAQRSYSPAEMLRGTAKRPQSLHGLTPMNPDRAGEPGDAIEQPRHGVEEH